MEREQVDQAFAEILESGLFDADALRRCVYEDEVVVSTLAWLHVTKVDASKSQVVRDSLQQQVEETYGLDAETADRFIKERAMLISLEGELYGQA